MAEKGWLVEFSKNLGKKTRETLKNWNASSKKILHPLYTIISAVCNQSQNFTPYSQTWLKGAVAELSVRYSKVAKQGGNVLTVPGENITEKGSKSDNKEEKSTTHRVFRVAKISITSV